MNGLFSDIVQSVRRVLITSSIQCKRSNFRLNGFYRGEGRSDGTLIEWDRDIDVLVTVSSPLILVEKNVVKLQSSEAAILGSYRKITYMRNETKISV